MKFIVIFAATIVVVAGQSAQYDQLGSSYGAATSYKTPTIYNTHAPYSVPSYATKNLYASVYAGPATKYTYPTPAAPVLCRTNFLVSCTPNVVPVPCQSVSYQPAYKAPGYKAPSY